MNHYYTDNSELKSKRQNIYIDFEGKEYVFTTDIGVFSKNKLDFGTEVMLKEFLKDNCKKNFNFLDIGCGYGAVSIIVSNFYPNCKYIMSDVNDRALEISKLNVEKYAINNVKLIKSNSFENIEEVFDIIMSNPPIRTGKETIFNIYENSYKHLNDNGYFYCVIQTKHGAKSTEKKLKEIFGNCVTLGIHSGYRVYRCIKEECK